MFYDVIIVVEDTCNDGKESKGTNYRACDNTCLIVGIIAIAAATTTAISTQELATQNTKLSEGGTFRRLVFFNETVKEIEMRRGGRVRIEVLQVQGQRNVHNQDPRELQQQVGTRTRFRPGLRSSGATCSRTTSSSPSAGPPLHPWPQGARRGGCGLSGGSESRPGAPLPGTPRGAARCFSTAAIAF